jgi:hypothetical protein
MLTQHQTFIYSPQMRLHSDSYFPFSAPALPSARPDFPHTPPSHACFSRFPRCCLKKTQAPGIFHRKESFMPTFKRTAKVALAAPASEVLRLLQDEPLKHLEILGVQVEEKSLPESGDCTGETDRGVLQGAEMNLRKLTVV